MNAVTQNALAALNNDKASAAADQAGAKIVYILREQDQIKKYQANIKVHQDALGKIAGTTLTDMDVLGRPFSTNPTPNEVAIMKAIKDRNDAAAKDTEAKSKVFLVEIDGCNAAIKGCNERIAKLREEMAALAAEVVTPEQVLG